MQENQLNQAIHIYTLGPYNYTLDPYVLSPYFIRTDYAGIRTVYAAYVLFTYCLRTYFRTVLVHAYCIRTVSVLYPYSLRRFGGDPHSNFVGGETTDADRVWMPADGVRRDYGSSTVPVRTDFIRSIRSIRETCNHFQNCAADEGGSGGNPQT